MAGEPHIINIRLFRIHVFQFNGILREAKAVDAVIAFGYTKKGFPVISFDPGSQAVFVIKINSPGVENCVDAQPLFEIGIGLRIQIISPGERNMFPCQYRVFLSFEYPVIKIRFPVGGGKQFFLSGCLLKVSFMNH